MDNVGKKGKIVYILLIAFFVIATVAVARIHEPWSDEAQSFLIARDNSLSEILYYAKFEGTSPLWFIIIKIFLTLGGNYNTYYILPIIFTTVGLFIFYFKIDAPKIFKILLPFTYFIFYQYTIIIRSYCLVFPCLMAICSIYKKRKENRIIYCLLLFIFMNICSYTFVISCSFCLIDIIELIIEIRKEKLSSNNKKNIIAIAVVLLELLISLIIIIPSADCNFEPKPGGSFFYIIHNATIGSIEQSNLTIIPIAFISIIGLSFIKEEKKSYQIMKFIILLFPLILENMVITSQMWHIGIVTIIIFASFILNDMINKNSITKYLMIAICLVQILWTFSSVKFDVKNNYSGSKDVADFLKENDYDKKTIYGFGFDITAILPYFENNIFKNQNSQKSFWIWSDSNNYIQNETLLEEEADIYVISNFYSARYKDLIEELKANNYEQYSFQGYMYTKTYIYEDKGYIVLLKQ